MVSIPIINGNESTKLQGHTPIMGCQGIKRGVVHSGQQRGIGRLTIGTEYGQCPLLPTAWCQLVAEALPLQLQALFRLRLGELKVSSIHLSMLGKGERKAQAGAVFFPIGIAEGEQRIRELDALALQHAVFRIGIEEEANVLFLATYANGSCTIGIGRKLIRPDFRRIWQLLVIQREKQEIYLFAILMASLILYGEL